jgi:hypothetical protein
VRIARGAAKEHSRLAVHYALSPSTQMWQLCTVFCASTGETSAVHLLCWIHVLVLVVTREMLEFAKGASHTWLVGTARG